MLTRSKLPQLHEDRLDQVTLGTPAQRPPLRKWLLEPGMVPGRWPIALAGGWWAVLELYRALIPAPADPNAAIPLSAIVAVAGFTAVLLAMVVGLGLRARIGLVLSVFAGGLVLLDTVLCPVSGHHESVGAWWFLGMAGFSGLVLASVVGLRRSRPPAPDRITT